MTVPSSDGAALRFGEQPPTAADVKDLRVGPEHDPTHLGVTSDPADSAGSQHRAELGFALRKDSGRPLDGRPGLAQP